MIFLGNAFHEGTLIITGTMALSQAGSALQAIAGRAMTLSLWKEAFCIATEKLSTAFRQHLHPPD